MQEKRCNSSKKQPAQGVLDLTDRADQAAVLEETSAEDVWGLAPPTRSCLNVQV